ncbi:MAG: Gmad2 immunoglobulin-like domain-containing protein [Candidatus Moranbacteria bacterium]|jgi:hypothetical protein|nr:Gmad2 immunoglobulin-like domain-containing protein [Candidatus Moranbacteria bacterium]
MENNTEQIKKEPKPKFTVSPKKIIIIIVALILIAIAINALFKKGDDKEEGKWVCEKGEWIMKGKTKEAKPEKACEPEAPQEQASTERVKPEEEMIKADSQKVAEGINIRVELPHVNETITSPLKLKGEAKGWYAEATFPVKLIDAGGNTLGEGTAKAEGDWQVDNYVPFTAEIEFNANGAKAGDLIFQKSNPSGAPENAGTFSFPVFFE